MGLRGEDVSGLRICTPSTDEVETHQLPVTVGVDRMRQIDKAKVGGQYGAVPTETCGKSTSWSGVGDAMIGHVEGNVYLEMPL